MKSTHIARPVVDKKRILRSELHARNNQTDQPSLRFIEIKYSRRWTRNLASLLQKLLCERHYESFECSILDFPSIALKFLFRKNA